MKIILSFFLWLIGIIHFIFVFSIIFSLLIFFPAVKVYPAVRILFRSQMIIMGISFNIIGLENFNNNGSYLIMGNHESLFDIFAVPCAVPMHFIGVVAEYHFSLPFWGKLINKWGCIPIKRNNIEEAKKSLEKAKDIIGGGTSIIILPEGCRTTTGKFKEFKKGPFHLALQAKADILPFAIRGLYEYNNKNSWLLNPKKASIKFGKPIPFNLIKNYSVEELKQKVYETILELKNNR